MTYTEFKIEFNKLYDNLATDGAPGVDPYEISLFLTEAQEDIIRALVTGSPQLSILNKTFEIDEDVRRSLNKIVKQYNTTSITSKEGITVDNSYFINVDSTDLENMWWVIWEQAKANITDCNKTKWLKVVPIMHDEANEMLSDPFINLDNHIIYRVDLNIEGIDTSFANKSGFELLSKNTVSEYKNRYIEKPEPIIVEDIQGTGQWLNFYPAGANLTVDGEHTPATCKLNSKIHRIILYKAVELAMAAYKDGSLQTLNSLKKGLT